MYTYDGCCGSCIYLNTNDYTSSKDRCRCTYRDMYCNLKDSKCSYYRYDPNKDYYDLNHRWHIVSTIRSILPEAIGVPGFDQFWNFRISVLEKDQQYSAVLRMYDLLGPFLARELTNDENREAICAALMEKWLVPIISLFQEQKFLEIPNKYAEMVDVLSNHYSTELRAYLKMKTIEAIPSMEKMVLRL